MHQTSAKIKDPYYEFLVHSIYQSRNQSRFRRSAADRFSVLPLMAHATVLAGLGVPSSSMAGVEVQVIPKGFKVYHYSKFQLIVGQWMDEGAVRGSVGRWYGRDGLQRVGTVS